MITGGCLCGATRYEVDELLSPVGHCHCPTCRRAHSAAFSTTATAARAAFRWTSGQDALRSFESSPGKRRFFCPVCGSHLIAAWDDRPSVIIRIGSVDDACDLAAPVAHIFTDMKAPWYEIEDSLPKFPGAPPRADAPETGS